MFQFFLNTSFNENEPIVMKPEEALDCVLRNDLDYLIISNFIIKKNQNNYCYPKYLKYKSFGIKFNLYNIFTGSLKYLKKL